MHGVGMVWEQVDFERMQGSIMVNFARLNPVIQAQTVLTSCSVYVCAQDAMSEAVEGADLMLYGVSESYKESANVSSCSNL